MKTRIGIILLILTMGMAGCGKYEVNKQKTVKDDVTESESYRENLFPHEVKKNISDELEVEAEVYLPENFSGFVKQYHITQKDFDEKAIFTALNIDKSEMENPASGTFYNDEMNLSIGNYWSFATKKGMEYRALAVPEFCSENKDLLFASKEQAKDDVFNVLQSALQMNTLQVNRYMVFDSESEKMREIKINEEEGYQSDIKTGETNLINILGDEEGGYYFELVQKIDEIPIYQFDQERDGVMIPGFKIDCIYTKNGIEYLESAKPYEIVMEDNDISIIDVNEAINLLCKKLDNIIITDKFKLTEMKLVYVPTEELLLKPVWEMTIQEAEDEVKVYFDADTGKELLL